jgi:hypothetical protein
MAWHGQDHVAQAAYSEVQGARPAHCHHLDMVDNMVRRRGLFGKILYSCRINRYFCVCLFNCWRQYRRCKLNNDSISIIALLATALVFYSPLSHPDTLPTHCNSGEFAYLNAKMYREIKGELGNDTGKILSLCADKSEEPFGKFIYRYGAIGKVEMEQIATTSDKFGLSTQSDNDSHAGAASISFSKGKYIYEVSEAMGMAGFGVRLSVYEAGKPILSLISAHHYEPGIIRINFDKASSSIFKLVKSVNPW